MMIPDKGCKVEVEALFLFNFDDDDDDDCGGDGDGDSGGGDDDGGDDGACSCPVTIVARLSRLFFIPSCFSSKLFRPALTINMIIYNSKTKNLITWPWRPSPRRPPCREPTPPSSPSPPCPRPDQGVNADANADADADAGNEPGRGIEPPPTQFEEPPFSLPSLAPSTFIGCSSFTIWGCSHSTSATRVGVGFEG